MATRGTNVLVVEDDPRVLDLERLILEGGGYTVTSAGRGEDAIDIMTDASPDLVLLDICLPGIDGFTTCKVIRKFSRVPIIMVTGNDSLEDKVKGLSIGADDYIAKPFSDKELFARSQAVLRRSQFDGDALGPSYRSSLGQVNTINAPGRAGRLWRDASQLLGDVLGRVKGQQDPAPEPSGAPGRGPRHPTQNPAGQPRSWAFPDGVKLWVLQIGRNLRVAFLSVAISLKQGIRRGLGSSLAERVRARVPPRQLADAVGHWEQSGPVHRLKTPAIKLWSAGAAAVSDAFARLTQARKQKDRSAAVSEGVNARWPANAEHTRQMAFLEELLAAYLEEASTKCSDPMISAPVLPLADVYPHLVLLSGRTAEYSREQFARDVYLLHRSGLSTTPTGARIQLPISRGVPNKVLTVTDDAGAEMRYYGVRFMQSPNRGLASTTSGRIFDPWDAGQYSTEIQQALASQMEWPSETFARLLAAQLGLKDLDQREVQQFAQITRDSLRGCLER